MKRDNLNYMTEYHRKYRKTVKGRTIAWKANKKWRNKNRIKIRATDKLRYAINHKKINKPNICSLCRIKEVSKNLHGHHTDYSKPLEVIWLCCKCHSKVSQKT